MFVQTIDSDCGVTLHTELESLRMFEKKTVVEAECGHNYSLLLIVNCI